MFCLKGGRPGCWCVTPCPSCISRLLGQHVGETAESPYLDPCLPVDLQDEVGPPGQRVHLRGTGDFDLCRVLLQPFLNRTNETQSSLNGVYQPPINYRNSQFYGFSEFYYCTEDVLRMGGSYNATKYSRAAKVRCHGNACTLTLTLTLTPRIPLTCTLAFRLRKPPALFVKVTAWSRFKFICIALIHTVAVQNNKTIKPNL